MHVLPPHSPTLLPPDWRGLINSARTEEQLVGITLDYLACWTPEEIARLPVHCRPGRVRDGEDLGRWAFELTSCHLAEALAPEDEALLLKMMLFVGEAAAHYARLQAARRTAEAT